MTEIDLGNKVIIVDSKMAQTYNNSSKNQCQDNLTAFLSYKKKELFPKKNGVNLK